MREQKDRYEIFLKVCETGSFSKAAEALNYTQSGISQMMAGLEEELGVKLFARINRGVTLTDNGTRLLPYVRELANQKNRLRQAAFNINHKVEGKLRVGSFSSITTLWMPEVVHYFKENYPKVRNNSSDYPYLSFEQGEHNSFYYSEEIFSTVGRTKNIRVTDRATLFNLLIGLNGYTVCSGVIDNELNGDNITAIPLDEEGNMKIGYIENKKILHSNLAEAYIEALKKHI